MCPFGANEVHVSSANAMPHSMPKAVKCELVRNANESGAEHLGHCSRVFPEIAEVGLLMQCVSK